MQLAPAEALVFRGHPSWRSMLGFHLKGLIAAIGAGVAAGLISALASGRVSAVAVTLLVAVVFGGAIAIGAIRRLRTTYTVTTRRVAVEVGLVSREAQETGLERIRNLSSRQSAWERLLGVGTVAFDTSGSPGSELSFRGLAEPREIVRALDAALNERAFFDHGPQARGFAQ